MPAPKDITDDELLKLLDSEDPSGFRIPMSLGEPHAELDKGNDNDLCMLQTAIASNAVCFTVLLLDSHINDLLIAICYEILNSK